MSWFRIRTTKGSVGEPALPAAATRPAPPLPAAPMPPPSTTQATSTATATARAAAERQRKRARAGTFLTPGRAVGGGPSAVTAPRTLIGF